MRLAYLKIGFAALALIAGVLLFVLGSGEVVVAAASSLVSAALGLVAGQAATVDRHTHDAVSAKLTDARAAVAKVTGEVAAAKVEK